MKQIKLEGFDKLPDITWISGIVSQALNLKPLHSCNITYLRDPKPTDRHMVAYFNASHLGEKPLTVLIEIYKEEA